MSTYSSVVGITATRMVLLVVLAVGFAGPTHAADPVPGIAPGRNNDAVSSNGKLVSVDLYSIDEKLCPGALVLFPEGEKPHRCIPCSGLSGETSDVPMSGLTYCA